MREGTQKASPRSWDASYVATREEEMHAKTMAEIVDEIAGVDKNEMWAHEREINFGIERLKIRSLWKKDGAMREKNS